MDFKIKKMSQCLSIRRSMAMVITTLLFSFIAAPLPSAHATLMEPPLTPVPASGGPIEVRSGIQFNGIHSIDSRTESFQADLYLWANWQDPRGLLLFSKKPVDTVSLPKDAVWGSEPILWNPSIELNTTDVNTSGRETINVHLDGDVGYEARLVGTFHPPEGTMNFRLFPFDSHWLAIVISSFDYNSEKVVFLPFKPLIEDGGKNKIVEKVRMQEWTVGDIEVITSNEVFVGDQKDEGFSVLTYKVLVSRKPAYYVFRWMLPLLLILVLAWLSLFSPVDKLEVQSSTVSAAFLSLVALNFVVAGDLPHCDYLTLFDHSLVTAYIAVLIIGIVIFRACQVSKADGDRLFKAARRSVPLTFLAVNLLGSFLFYIKSPDRNVIAADILIFVAWFLYIAVPHFRTIRRGNS